MVGFIVDSHILKVLQWLCLLHKKRNRCSWAGCRWSRLWVEPAVGGAGCGWSSPAFWDRLLKITNPPPSHIMYVCVQSIYCKVIVWAFLKLKNGLSKWKVNKVKSQHKLNTISMLHHINTTYFCYLAVITHTHTHTHTHNMLRYISPRNEGPIIKCHRHPCVRLHAFII